MKSLFLTLLLSLTYLISSAQTELPRYLIENGDTIGVIISVEQAQKLDNNSELLELFKKLRIDCDNLDTHYIQVINSLNEQVALLKVNVSELEGQSSTLSSWNESLKEQLKNSEKSNKLCNEELENKDQEIKILKNELRRQKIKKVVSVAGNVALIVVTTILIIKS
jgi:predicted RNase H-like nuclease (RuvC/YqgF family)